ncbi:hypothetical protein JCM8547_006040 [Rhodosporidiobolus lusitaniae]
MGANWKERTWSAASSLSLLHSIPFTSLTLCADLLAFLLASLNPAPSPGHHLHLAIRPVILQLQWAAPELAQSHIRSRNVHFVEHKFPLTGYTGAMLGEGPAIQPVHVISAPAPPPPAGAPAAAPPVIDRLVTPAARRSSTSSAYQCLPFESVTPETPAPQLDYFQSVANAPSLINFLDNNPFKAYLRDIEALISSIEEELDASGSDFTLPSSDPRNHCEAAHDIVSEHCCREEQGKFPSLLANYKCFHFVDCK